MTPELEFLNRNVEFLFVNCCVEPTRASILDRVLENVQEQMGDLAKHVTCFDNASTEPGTLEKLKNTFDKIHKSDTNVGYWTAVSWWLDKLYVEKSNKKLAFVIESDTTFFGFDKMARCARTVLDNDTFGSCLVQEYSVKDMHLYNKDVPVNGSRNTCWRSHHNPFTNKPVYVRPFDGGDVYRTTFPTKVPALNRLSLMQTVFGELRQRSGFSERDFQELCFSRYNENLLLDGGLFNDDLGSWGSGVVGSYSLPQHANVPGPYQNSRLSSIVPGEKYNVIDVW